jgi:glycosyltransferase involved in cell wall biosynthesis
MSKRWIVSELFYPDEVSTGFVMTKIAERLAKEGEVNVICGPAGYEKGSSISGGSLDCNIRIHRVKVPVLDKNKLRSRAARMLLLTIKMGWKIVRELKHGDHLILVTNPTSLLILVRYIKMLKRIRYTIIVHDVFPENLVASGLATKKSPIYRLLLPSYNNAYRAADQLIAVGEDMKHLLSAKVGSSENIFVVQNWADLEEVFPIQNFDRSKYLGINLDGKIVIGFAGNIGRVQGLEQFINCFHRASNPNLVLTIIGEGALKNQLQLYTVEKNIRNIYFLGNRARKEQIQFLNSCDIGLVSLCAGMYGLGVPSKTYNIMAAGKPLLFIGDKDAEVELYIRKFNCGWAFHWFDTEKLETFLQGLHWEQRAEFLTKGQNALHAARNYFSRERILNLFESIISEA